MSGHFSNTILYFNRKNETKVFHTQIHLGNDRLISKIISNYIMSGGFFSVFHMLVTITHWQL
jgi:hypothetical protein